MFHIVKSYLRFYCLLKISLDYFCLRQGLIWRPHVTTLFLFTGLNRTMSRCVVSCMQYSWKLECYLFVCLFSSRIEITSFFIYTCLTSETPPKKKTPKQTNKQNKTTTTKKQTPPLLVCSPKMYSQFICILSFRIIEFTGVWNTHGIGIGHVLILDLMFSFQSMSSPTQSRIFWGGYF